MSIIDTRHPDFKKIEEEILSAMPAIKNAVKKACQTTFLKPYIVPGKVDCIFYDFEDCFIQSKRVLILFPRTEIRQESKKYSAMVQVILHKKSAGAEAHAQILYLGNQFISSKLFMDIRENALLFLAISDISSREREQASSWGVHLDVQKKPHKTDRLNWTFFNGRSGKKLKTMVYSLTPDGKGGTYFSTSIKPQS